MKVFATIFILAAALFVHSAARAASSSLEIVSNDEHVSFYTATNVPLELTFRNVGVSNIDRVGLLTGLSVIWDGHEYAIDPKKINIDMGKGVETSFKVLTVLKGERDIKQLVLHHFALASAPANRGPSLVSFKPDDNKQFLMFLQKEPDGRYVAVSGQTDPQVSIAGIENNFPVR